MVFSLVFAGAFYWFYTFTTERALERLRADMRATLTGAAAGVDVSELMALYREGDRNSAGFSDDPRYHRLIDWFDAVHQIEPRVWLYTYVVGPASTNRRIGASAVSPDQQDEQLEIIYLVDLWAKYDPAKAAHFLESDIAGPRARQVLEEGGLVETRQIYTDKWGSWLTAFTPLRDTDGEIAAVIGLDIQANYVFQMQQTIRSRVLLSFVITYGVLFILVHVLSGILTRHLAELTQAAQQIGKGDYDQSLSFAQNTYFPDEMNTLAQVFETMVAGIRTREQMIRESQQAEDDMRHSLQQQRDLNELKSRFITMVSHELRTPLTTIRTSAELLEQFGDIATAEQQTNYYLRIRTAVKHMTQLLEDVLTIGQTEAGKLEFNPTPLNLKEFCQEIVDEHRLGIGTSYAIRFISTGTCQEGCLDKKLLRSVVTNLLSNAIKYSPSGGEIDLLLSCQDDTVQFEIRDQGIGIPLEDQPRLFELFHRASNTAAIRGTGLGLAIVKQCVAQHRGTITFESQEGKGSMFRITMPLYCGAQSAKSMEGDRHR